MSGTTAHEKAEEATSDAHQKALSYQISTVKQRCDVQVHRAQDPSWKSKEKAEEVTYAHQKEREPLEAIQRVSDKEETQKKTEPVLDRDFEGGYGGQEDLEDRYASTYGAH